MGQFSVKMGGVDRSYLRPHMFIFRQWGQNVNT